MTEEQKEIYQDWKDNVNMSRGELARFYDSEEGKKAGLSKSEANKQGIDYGRESARWILKMKDTPVSEWTDNMWRWAKKQNSFISRMSGVKGRLYNEKGEKTRKHLALLIWGNNPEKKSKGGKLNKEAEKLAEKSGEVIQFEPEGFDAVFMKRGGRTLAQTPAPAKDRIKGSSVNKPKSASSGKSGSSIELSSETIDKIQNIIDKHNESHPNKKITLSVAKAVVRRGMGAYSSSHRPTISGGKPNSRVAWGLARLKAFVFKSVKGYSKSGKYSQDNDLLNELGIKHQKYAEGGLIAPNGKPSNLTPEQYILVRTPEFKAWFGDWENDPKNASKVVDDNGEPLVVWHTTNNEFNKFDKRKSREGFFFSPQRNRLEVYNKSKINSYFLNLRNPSHEIFKIDLKYLKSIGYDGVMDYGHARHLGNENLYEIIAFEPNQIKLADGTNTTFDAENPDIRYDEGGNTDEPKIALPDVYSSKTALKRVLNQQGYDLVLLKDKEGETSHEILLKIAKKHHFNIDEIEKELEKGMEVEFEHTDDPEVAEKIALDHLSEHPKYHHYLAKMEELMKIEQ
jgi:hypothetical protein